MFRSKPNYDWSSHACDAMRYCRFGLQEINTRQAAPQSVADNENTGLYNYGIIIFSPKMPPLPPVQPISQGPPSTEQRALKEEGR